MAQNDVYQLLENYLNSYEHVVLGCTQPDVPCVCHNQKRGCKKVKRSNCNSLNGVCECKKNFYSKLTGDKSKCTKAPSEYLCSYIFSNSIETDACLEYWFFLHKYLLLKRLRRIFAMTSKISAIRLVKCRLAD